MKLLIVPLFSSNWKTIRFCFFSTFLKKAKNKICRNSQRKEKLEKKIFLCKTLVLIVRENKNQILLWVKYLCIEMKHLEIQFFHLESNLDYHDLFFEPIPLVPHFENLEGALPQLKMITEHI